MYQTVGFYGSTLRGKLPDSVNVGGDKLIESMKAFGIAYRAVPNDNEFECQDGSLTAILLSEDIDVPGSDANAGEFLEADAGTTPRCRSARLPLGLLVVQNGRKADAGRWRRGPSGRQVGRRGGVNLSRRFGDIRTRAFALSAIDLTLPRRNTAPRHGIQLLAPKEPH